MKHSTKRRKAIEQMNEYHRARLEAEFGPVLADLICPHLDAALGHLAIAAADTMHYERDVRDLFVFFSQMLSDANNVMEGISERRHL
jgi:hypothetical protein